MAELPEHHAPEVGREVPNRLAFPEPFGIAVSEAPNHQWMITLRVTMRKRDLGLVKLTFGCAVAAFIKWFITEYRGRPRGS